MMASPNQPGGPCTDTWKQSAADGPGPAPAGGQPARRAREEVKRTSMRKNFAIGMVALLAMTVAFAAMGCGAKKAEESSTPPAEQSSAPMDSTMQMGADTTHK